MVTVVNQKLLPDDYYLRVGFFRVSRNLFDDVTPELIEFMKNFLIIKAELLPFNDAIEYIAISLLFEPLKDKNHSVPEYDFQITKKHGGGIDIETIKVGQENAQGSKLLRLLRKMDG